MTKVRAFQVCLTVLVACSLLSCSQAAEDELWTQARRIHAEAIVIDAHAHLNWNDGQLNLGEKTGEIEVDLVTQQEGGLDAVIFSIPLIRAESEQSSDPEVILNDINTFYAEVERNKELAEVALDSEDIRRIHDSGRCAVLYGMENEDPFSGDLQNLRNYYEAGVRMITLTQHPLTTSADSNNEAGEALKLDDFGTQIINEMNRLGMIIDITHTPDNLQLAIIRASAQPVIASHSCVRALNDIPREIPDSIIQALAEKGGVMCVTFFPGHISQKHPDQPVYLDDLIDHIDHIVELVGIDHVGFGSDFQGGEDHTVGLESAAELPSLTYQLLKRGYSAEGIHKILGGNLLRVFEAVQSYID